MIFTVVSSVMPSNWKNLSLAVTWKRAMSSAAVFSAPTTEKNFAGQRREHGLDFR